MQNVWMKSKGLDDTLRMCRMIRICLFCALLKAFFSVDAAHILFWNIKTDEILYRDYHCSITSEKMIIEVMVKDNFCSKHNYILWVVMGIWGNSSEYTQDRVWCLKNSIFLIRIVTVPMWLSGLHPSFDSQYSVPGLNFTNGKFVVWHFIVTFPLSKKSKTKQKKKKYHHHHH